MNSGYIDCLDNVTVKKEYIKVDISPGPDGIYPKMLWGTKGGGGLLEHSEISAFSLRGCITAAT